MMGDQEPEQGEDRRKVQGPSRSRIVWWAAAILLVGLGVVGGWLATSGAWKGWQAVAKLDGKRITRADLDQHLTLLARQGGLGTEMLADPARRKEAERFALEDLITRRLLLAEARRLKIAVEPGEEDLAFRKAHGGKPGEFKLADAAEKAGRDVGQMREDVRRQLLLTRLVEKVTEDVMVGEEDVTKYYEAHPEAFAAPGAARLRLLIVGTREEAERLRGEILKGADFAALVREHSKGGRKESGGDLGWVDPRMMPAAIATAVAAISETGVTPVIEARGDFYVVRVEGRRVSRQIPLAEVKDHIREVLTAERKQAKFAEWLQRRRQAARVEVYR